MAYIGEIAALFTSLCWAVSAVGFTYSTRLVGSQVTNRVRVIIALLLLAILNATLYGQPIPLNAGASRWMWFSISGVLGLALGDAFLFQSYQDVGPRIGLLLLSLAPVFGSAIAWLFFGEILTLIQVAGITVTLAGISWVVLSRPTSGEERPRAYGRGVLFGVLAAFGQAIGLVFSKQGMVGDFPPFAGTIMRMIAAVLALWIAAGFQKQVGGTFEAIRLHFSALQWIAFGALIGPVLGIAASLLAVQHAEVGVASTLIALPPVFMLPISYFVFKERFGWPAIGGTFVAMAGVTLLFLA
jgi:drug/metabolite transporter (DMT)-like permease